MKVILKMIHYTTHMRAHPIAVVIHFSNVEKNWIIGLDDLLMMPRDRANKIEKLMVPKMLVPSWYFWDIFHSPIGTDKFLGGTNTVRYWERLALTIFGGYKFLQKKLIWSKNLKENYDFITS